MPVYVYVISFFLIHIKKKMWIGAAFDAVRIVQREEHSVVNMIIGTRFTLKNTWLIMHRLKKMTLFLTLF